MKSTYLVRRTIKETADQNDFYSYNFFPLRNFRCLSSSLPSGSSLWWWGITYVEAVMEAIFIPVNISKLAITWVNGKDFFLWECNAILAEKVKPRLDVIWL